LHLADVAVELDVGDVDAVLDGVGVQVWCCDVSVRRGLAESGGEDGCVGAEAVVGFLAVVVGGRVGLAGGLGVCQVDDLVFLLGLGGGSGRVFALLVLAW
jgi:hypothetical protein